MNGSISEKPIGVGSGAFSGRSYARHLVPAVKHLYWGAWKRTDKAMSMRVGSIGLRRIDIYAFYCMDMSKMIMPPWA